MTDRTLLVKFEGKVDPSLEAAADKARKTIAGTGEEVEAASKRTDTASIALGAAAGNLVAQGLTAVGGELKSFLDGSISAASDLAESANVTTLVFGAQAETMKSFFKNADQSIGMSESAARSAAANVGGLLQNMGFANEESAAWSETLLTLSADMGSAFNMDPQQAIEAIGAGLRGEAEPLKKFNVFLSDAAVKSKAMEMGLYSGSGALDQNAAAQARLALITEQTSKIQGDFAATSDEEANKTRIVAAQMEDLQAKIGSQLLPVKKELLSIVSEKLIPAFEQFVGWLSDAGGWIQKNSGWIVPLAAGLTILTTGLMLFGIQQQIVTAGGLLKFLTTAASSTGLYTAAQWLLNAALSANPIGLVVLALVALGAGLVIAWNKSETFREIVTAAWEGIKGAASGVVTWFTDTAWPAVSGFLDNIGEGFRVAVDVVAGWWDGLKAKVAAPVKWIADNVVNPLLSGIEGIATTFGIELSLGRWDFAGFADGGYTGAGARNEPAGVVHRGEVVWSQRDVAAWGGAGTVDAMRQWRGYEDGGIVGAIAGFLGNPLGALENLIQLVPGAGVFGDILNAIPGKILGWVGDWITEKIASMFSAGGGGMIVGGGILPVNGVISSPYGYRIGPFNGAELHDGVDIAAPMGTPVVAPLPGQVTFAGWNGGYGNQVTLSHGGFTTFYAHMSSILAGVGQLLAAGQVLGLVGSTGMSTGPHLHWGSSAGDPMQILFDQGGMLQPGLNLTRNDTGRPEPVLTSGQWDSLRMATDRPSLDSDELARRFASAVADALDQVMTSRSFRMDATGLYDEVGVRLTRSLERVMG